MTLVGEKGDVVNSMTVEIPPVAAPAPRGSVLLVDDELLNLKLLAPQLERAGYAVTVCVDGESAVRAVRAAPFDLVILDLWMSGINGYETLTGIRSMFSESSLPVIMATSSTRREDIVKCLDLGANDYVTKPIDVPVLMARMRSQLAASRSALREIAIGGEIQRGLLIGSAPAGVAGLDVAALTVPSRCVDGDFYEFYEHGEGVVDLIVGDAMGKGVPVALLGAATKMNFGKAIAHLLARRQSAALPRLEHIVERVNAQMVAQLVALESFVAVTAARLDLCASTVTLVDCGNTPLLHWRRNCRRVDTVSGESMPLGFGVEDRFQARQLDVADGDVLLLYSDGLTEACAPDGTPLGLEPLKEVLAAEAGSSAAAILKAIESRLSAHCETDLFRDDVTCVVLKLRGDGVDPRRRQLARRLPSEAGSLRTLRTLFREALAHLPDGPALPDADGLELAVNEVAANIIDHAHGRDPTRSFEVQLRLDPDQLEVEFRYHGPNFDPSTVPEPSFNGLDEHGYGLYLVRAVVHELRFSTGPAGEQVVRLRHRLRHEGKERHATSIE